MGETKGEEKSIIAIIVSKDTLDMAYPPFILAQTAAAMGMEAHLFFTFWGTQPHQKGRRGKGQAPRVNAFLHRHNEEEDGKSGSKAVERDDQRGQRARWIAEKAKITLFI